MNWLGMAAALSAALAIGAGAFGAHGAEKHAADLLRTGAEYQLVHAVAALVAMQMGGRGPGWLFVIGAALFAGSIYGLAMGGPRWLGPVTPVGGLLMIAGWLWLVARFVRP